jgi:GH15 family glucan-1,4-alpha-glucosidase
MGTTNPSTTSTRALYLSNWNNMTGVWKAGKLTQLDSSTQGPCLGELHYLSGSLARRDVNQIVEYEGFFRDETNNIKYNQMSNFDCEGWFENGASNAGVLTTNYLNYAGASVQPAMTLSRSYAAPPNQPFFVVAYTLTNPTSAALTFNVLDKVHPNNVVSTETVHGWYDAVNNALIADMTASGQLFLFVGALQPVNGFQVGNEADISATSATGAAWYSFDASGTLQNNADLTVPDLDLAFNCRVTVAAASSQTIYFYIGVCETQAETEAAIAAARASTGDAWFSTTATAYNAWLTNGSSGKRVHFDDVGLNQLFDRALIMIKNVQNPVSGAFCATTNPFAYGYKNWVRDSAITSIALDASGHHAEAESHFRWLASLQGSDGTWKTTYDMWSSAYVPFVEPEYDSIGAFIYGVYRHYTLTAETQFLTDLWPNVKNASDWVLSNIQPNGFGQADYSIWEEQALGLEHNTYTQTWYVIGLYATQCMAELLGETSLTDWYAGGPASIMTAMQRPSNWYPPGMWNPLSYYNRAVNADNSVQPLIDSSSDVLVALGAIDHESGRASDHISTIVKTLNKQTYGLCRYLGDTFYYTGAWSPGGNEALGPEPSWPQMSMWVAIYEILTGDLATALSRLQWLASITGAGYMPSGEAVSNVTLQPLVSSMCEPLTASSFILAALIYEGQYALGIVPPIYNAGTWKSISVSTTPANDWSQWSNVPYFVGPQTTSAPSATYQIKRVYVANDGSNLYVRVDSAGNQLFAYQQQPLFALRVYSQDFANPNATGTTIGLSGESLRRPMVFMLERHSDSNLFQHWTAAGGAWSQDSSIGGVIPPQWDAATGRIEAVVPLSSVSSGSPVFASNWTRIMIVLAYFDAGSSSWRDGDSLLLYYRLSTSDQNWIYGNIDL